MPKSCGLFWGKKAFNAKGVRIPVQVDLEFDAIIPILVRRGRL
jgi:hypothetical protein